MESSALPQSRHSMVYSCGGTKEGGGAAIAMVCHSPTQGTARETRAGAGT